MNPFTKLFKPREPTEQQEVSNKAVGSGYNFYFGGTTDGKNVNERSAMQMTAVYSCVRILAEAVASLPLHLYKYNDKGGKEKALTTLLRNVFILKISKLNLEQRKLILREVQ